MMYLGKVVQLKDDSNYNMLGVFDYETTLADMKLKLGYRSVIANEEVYKGHEFHYSGIKIDSTQKGDYIVKSARNSDINMPVYRKSNVWSSYFHIYLGQAEKMKSFINLFFE